MSRLNLLYRRSHRHFFNPCRWLRWLNLWKKWETGLSYWGRRSRQYRYMETMHLWRMHAPFLDLAREFLANNQEYSKCSACVRRKLFLISDTWLDTWLVFHYIPLCITYFISQMVHDLAFVLRWVMDALGKWALKILQSCSRYRLEQLLRFSLAFPTFRVQVIRWSTRNHELFLQKFVNNAWW